jgi:hypothetical protein
MFINSNRGGAQDPIDRDEAWRTILQHHNIESISSLELAARICCIRELFEGILLK